MVVFLDMGRQCHGFKHGGTRGGAAASGLAFQISHVRSVDDGCALGVGRGHGAVEK